MLHDTRLLLSGERNPISDLKKLFTKAVLTTGAPRWPTRLGFVGSLSVIHGLRIKRGLRKTMTKTAMNMQIMMLLEAVQTQRQSICGVNSDE